jgi:hypothetical protein
MLIQKQHRSADSITFTPRFGLSCSRIVATRHLTLEVARFRTAEDQGAKTQGIITTRRVSERFSQTLLETQKHNPSLTQRVGIVANAQLQNI